MTKVHSCCRNALEAFDRIVADRPHVRHERVASAVQCIIQFRDALITERRAGGSAQSDHGLLPSVNSLLSLASSAEFPLVGVRWERIVAIRDALRNMGEQELAEGADASARRESDGF